MTDCIIVMKIQILDKGFVELLDSMGDDLAVTNAARVSFGKRKTELNKADKELIKYLADNNHMSPFRHCQLQFHVKAPEFVWRQAWKHLVGIEWTSQSKFVDIPHNEISGRYVVYEDEFYIPDMFRKQSKNNKQATVNQAVDNNLACLDIYTRAVYEAYDRYKELIARGVGKEQARGVLPVSFYTQCIITMSLEAVANFVKLRDHPHAQFEIQEYARAFKKLAYGVAPISMEALGV